ncbi:hypothetical protein [Pyruvatibacter mobilis]|uniref:hypothetical protein n=1 Tax=Pyruvatibacter mobilis TaxID=1712261 RepID=UPI003BAFEFD6
MENPLNSEERAAEAVRVFLTKTRNGVDMEQAMQAALEAAGLNDLVFIRDTLVEAAMPDHPKPGHFSWELSKLRVAYEAALTGETNK